jgi:hypothetical protein
VSLTARPAGGRRGRFDAQKRLTDPKAISLRCRIDGIGSVSRCVCQSPVHLPAFRLEATRHQG